MLPSNEKKESASRAGEMSLNALREWRLSFSQNERPTLEQMRFDSRARSTAAVLQSWHHDWIAMLPESHSNAFNQIAIIQRNIFHCGRGSSAMEAGSGADAGGGRSLRRAARDIASYGERTLTSLSK
jgi:hypothetical protein